MSTVLLREVPGTSPVHRLWAGTKIVAAVIMSVLLMTLPTWPTLALIACFLVGTCVAARIPVGAVPRPPRWIWALVILGGVLNGTVGRTALLGYLQAIVLTILLFGGAILLSWTTPMNEIAPAISILGAPLRKLRIPVDEWAVAIALCLRSLPLLLEEMRLLQAARRLRPRSHYRREHPLVDIVTATMSVSLRRAGELGEAITARGGTGALTAYPVRPGRADATALVLVSAVAVTGAGLGLLTL